MSRRIMEWPYNKTFGAPVEVDADTIEEFELPGVRMEAFDFYSNETCIASFLTKAKCYEDKEGIFIKIVEEDREGNLTSNESETVKVDEKEFVTDIYNAIAAGDTAEDSQVVQNTVIKIATDYAMSKLSGGKWFFRVNYEGFGVICTGNEIIGTVDVVCFDKEKVTLDFCVGNINLNNVEDCNVQFNVNGKCFKLTEFTMDNVKSDNDFYCTYELKNYKGEVINSTPVDDKIADLIPYSFEEAETFVAQRSKIIDGDKKNKFAEPDDLDDLLD